LMLYYNGDFPTGTCTRQFNASHGKFKTLKVFSGQLNWRARLGSFDPL
jgi:hypothetical protein